MVDCHVSTAKKRDSAECDASGVADPELGAFAVADGMGGRAGGALASPSAVNHFVDELKEAVAIDRLKAALLQIAVATVTAKQLCEANMDAALEQAPVDDIATVVVSVREVAA